MNEESSVYPHYAVMVHFSGNDEHEIFDAEEDWDFESIDSVIEVSDDVAIWGKLVRGSFQFANQDKIVEELVGKIVSITPYLKHLKNQGLSPEDVVTRITSKQVSNSMGTFQVAVFEVAHERGDNQARTEIACVGAYQRSSPAVARALSGVH